MTGSAIATARAIRAGETSAVAVIEAALADIAARDGQLNCFTTITAARARASAAQIDAAIKAGRDPGPLAGVPFAVKNLFDIEGVTTLAGSKILAGQPPASRDGPLIQRLCAAGAVLLGALSMDEFAYGFVTENAHYGPTRNPHDPTRIAGGSSGGSAAAVAAGFVPLTLGSDTNGSIRLPAALCGIFGLKPTYGRLPRSFTYPFVHSFDHLGPFARHVDDLALAYDLMQGQDEHDPAQISRAVQPALPGLRDDIAPLRFAVLDDFFAQGAEPEALAAVSHVASALGATAFATLPAAGVARAAAFCITAAEGGHFHEAHLHARYFDYDPATRGRLFAGSLMQAGVVEKAQRVRAWFRAEAARLFTQFDILLAPATPCPAPKIGQKTMMIGGREVPTRPHIGLYTQPISFIGLPVVTVPVSTGRMPLGVQIIAPPWQEARALRVAAYLEQAGICTAPIAGHG